jgi:N-hydroxyarylamine O-acetyltransferase
VASSVRTVDLLVGAYLDRLGLEIEPPTVEGLFRIHRAHAERVAYETLWIQLGERWSIDPSRSMARIATTRRGGYCYQLNGALGELLARLGYRVQRHVGGVHGVAGPSEAELTNHLVLTVSGLPSAANPEGVWYVDAGLGDALYEPLPLVAGPYDQRPFHLILEAAPEGVGDWHLVHDPAGSFTGMAWRAQPAAPDAFAQRHRWLSTSPDSGFVKYLTVQKRDATGADVLRGLTFRRIGEPASERVLGTDRELFEVLGDLFGLDVASIGADARSRLWDRVSRAHEEWEAAGRP